MIVSSDWWVCQTWRHWAGERDSAFTGLPENMQGQIKIKINAYSIADRVFHQSTGHFLVYYELPHSFSDTHYKFPLMKKGSQCWQYACFCPIRWLASLSGWWPCTVWAVMSFTATTNDPANMTVWPNSRLRTYPLLIFLAIRKPPVNTFEKAWTSVVLQKLFIDEALLLHFTHTKEIKSAREGERHCVFIL